MKKIIVLLLLVLMVAFPAYGWEFKKRVKGLEERIADIEEAISKMVQATIPKNIDLFMDSDAPGTGETKLVKSGFEWMDDCEALTQWSVHPDSGDGVTIALDDSNPKQGSGAIRVSVPEGSVAIIKLTIFSGSWDLSTKRRINFSLSNEGGSNWIGWTAYFGEVAYDEQSLSLGVGPGIVYTWYDYVWDISAIVEASKNAVTMFAIRVTNIDAGTREFLIDNIYNDIASDLESNDGERNLHHSPPYTGTFTATATDPLTVTVPRKGVVKSVIIAGDTGSAGAYFATSDMGGKAKLLAATAVLASNQITAMGEGYFTVTGNCNINGVTYYYQVAFED